MKGVSPKPLLILMFLVLAAGNAASEEERTLDLTGVLRTSYSLGCDTAGVKDKEEAIYFAYGDTNKALATLKNILIEHKPAVWTLNDNEQINIIVFRGVLPGLGKIEVNKVVSKSSSFEIYAKYIDISDINVASQPAVIIPVGKLPIGKYPVVLYVDDQLHKKANFTVRRAPFAIDLRKKEK